MEMVTNPLSVDDINELNDELNERLKAEGIDAGEVLEEAREDVTLWDGYFQENVTRGKDDLKFVIRDQWTALERSEFNRLFKPAQTFNKIYDPVKKIVGEQRKNKPDLLVRSLNGKISQQQINLRTDLVRTISYQSQNDLVYQTAFMQALLMGFGAFEIGLDYESARSFHKTARFHIIPDCTRTSFDPTALKPHKGDGNFCARQYVYTKEEFYAEYPWVMNPVSYSDPRSLLDFQWETRDTIVVNKYTRKEWYNEKIILLSNGMVVTADQWEDMQENFEMYRAMAKDAQVVGGMILDQIPKVRAERHTKDYKIRQYVMTQNQIIDFQDWPSKQLPMIFVCGDSFYMDGREYTKSFIHEAKDAQRTVNYIGSEISAEIKNRRREQWIGTPDNIAGYEQFWRNPELQTGILLARPDPKTGAMPLKQQASEIPQTLLQQYQRACQDIREILGFSEQEALQGRDMSGKARRERKMEGSMSAYVFFDNLNQAIEQAGRVVLDLLPTIVGEEERHMMVQKPDGRTESITLNKKTPEGIVNMLEEGEFDVEIDTGPSFAVQKDIALEFFQQTIAANPQTFPLIADLWAKNLDIQYMPQVADRFKMLVPPEVIAKEEGKPMPPQQPSPQDQMMQAELQAKQQELALNEQKMKVEEQAIIERAEELKIRKNKHLLEQAEMILKAQEMKDKSKLEREKLGIEHGKLAHAHSKTDHDFTSKLTQVVADLHKTQMKPEEKKEKKEPE